MLCENKDGNTKSHSSDVFEATRRASDDSDASITPAAPSYSDVAANRAGSSSQVGSSAPAPSTQGVNVPSALVPADNSVQQTPFSRTNGLNADLERNPSVPIRGRGMDTSHHANRRALKRFVVGFGWAVLAWFLMLMVAGSATEMYVHDISTLAEDLVSVWRNVISLLVPSAGVRP
ncbi:unnamed protein product [Sympodiomycopsis kandeliae]